MSHSFIRTMILAGAMLLGACAATQPKWPAISDVPGDTRIQGRWVWHELLADNVEAEKAFYRAVFGWEYETHGTGSEAYTLVRANGRPIAGIVHIAKPADAARGARWLALMSVPDAARAAEAAMAGGGKTVLPARTFEGRGQAAVLTDPEGALFGVIRTTGGDPPDEFPAYNDWLWTELWAKDAGKMAAFYTPLGSYEVSREEGPGDRLELRLKACGYPRAGILELERKDLPTTWVPYVRVADVKKTVADIEKAGGRIVVAPNPEIRQGKVAVFLDPLGAAAAVVEWPDEPEDQPKGEVKP